MSAYGYRAGMRQASVELDFVAKAASNLKLTRIDNWLKDHFATRVPGPDSANYALMMPETEPKLALGVTPLLARALVVYKLFCEANELPCVEPGRIIQLERDGERWRVRLLLPAVNGLERGLFIKLFQYSADFVNTLRRTEPSADNAQRLYQELEKHLLRRYKGLIPSGRANSFLAGLAYKLDVPFEHLGGGLMQLGHGVKIQITERSTCLEDSALGARTSSDKFRASMLLTQAGLPVPSHELVSSVKEALDAALRLGWPVVVKPADRERSEGVTIDVSDEAALDMAFQKARSFSARVLVEEQAPGLCHRIFIARNKLVYASKRIPKSVRGVGAKTVEQLVREANGAELRKPPWSRKKPFLLDDLALSCLAKEGLRLDTLLAEGCLAPLRPITGNEWGGSAVDVTRIIHPDNVTLAIQAASALGLSVAGVDLMTNDIARPWHENGALINEVNFRPYLDGDPENDKAAFLQFIVSGDGRIPVHAVAGEVDPWPRARQVRHALAAEGVRAHLCGLDRAESPDGDAVHLACSGLFFRCRALLHSRHVEALIMVVDSPDFLTSGLPTDRLDGLHVVGDPMSATARPMLDFLSGFAVDGLRFAG